MDSFPILHTWQRKHQSKIMGRYHVASFPLLPAWKRKHLRKKRQQIAATSMWTKLGFTITRATTSTMTNPIFFFFLFYHFLGNAPSSAYTLQYQESGDISKNVLVHQPSIRTVPSGNPPKDRAEEPPNWKLWVSRELPGNRVANRFDITVHYQRHQIRWRRTSVEVEAQQQEVRQTSVAHNRGPTCSSAEDDSGSQLICQG